VDEFSDRGHRDQSASAAEKDAATAWAAVRERLRSSVPESTYRIWLDPIRLAGTRGNVLHLTAPDGIRTWAERRYSWLIDDTLRDVAEGRFEATFTPGEYDESNEAGASRHGVAALNPNYTFDRFVIGEGNRLAHAAALAVAEAPAEAYNPLFIHGPPGLGKTHLLTAIANYLAGNAPELSVRYTTAESFTNEFVRALQESGAERFKQRYREIDVLLIDDVQFLEGKHHTEEEFFHTFNTLYESGSQLVLSADRIPSELSTLATRLRDRFEWGLTIAVERPTLGTRTIVLRRLVREAGLETVEPDALTELARRVGANIRQLNGALTRVVAHASLMARPLSADLVNEVIPESSAGESTPETIRDGVAQAFSVTIADITGPRRTAGALQARQVAIYLTREMTDLSLPAIGSLYGGRDHSTVLNAIRRARERLETDPELAERVAEIRLALNTNPQVNAGAGQTPPSPL
jgi:chromosomal replication initiator protein